MDLQTGLVKIIVTPNVPNPKRMEALVTKRFLKRLEQNENITGYKRYSIDICEENLSRMSNDNNHLRAFLSVNYNIGIY